MEWMKVNLWIRSQKSAYSMGAIPFFAGLLALLLFTSDSVASDRIELRNDSSFVTSQYWEEDNQIKFYYGGGIVGLNRSTVNAIKEAEIDDDEMRYIDEEKATSKQEKKEAATAEIKAKDTKNPTKPVPPKEEFLSEKEGIMLEIQSAQNAFRKAKDERDTERIKENRIKILSSQAKLNALQQRVRNAHDGVVPGWWDSN